MMYRALKSVAAGLSFLAVFAVTVTNASSQDLENRTTEEWKTLADTDPAQFLRDQSAFGSVTYQAKLMQCSKAINDQYKNHPDYIKGLREQQLVFREQCHSQCKAGPASGSSSCDHGIMNAYDLVKAACERKRESCALQSDPAIAQHPLKCDCDDLCEDPEIVNTREAVSHCGDGFVAVYEAFKKYGGKMVDALSSGDTYSSGTATSAMDGVANWWRSTFDTSENIKKRYAEVVKMKETLDACRDYSDHMLDRDYTAVKIDNLAMACTSRSYRAQTMANKGVSEVCFMITGVAGGATLRALRLGLAGRVATGVEKFYSGASAGVKSLIDQVFRSGVSPSLSASQHLANLSKGTAAQLKRAQELLEGAGKSATEKALSRMQGCPVAVGWLSWWVPEAYAGGGLCELNILEEVLGSGTQSGAKLASTTTQADLAAARSQLEKLNSNPNSNPLRVQEAKERVAQLESRLGDENAAQPGLLDSVIDATQSGARSQGANASAPTIASRGIGGGGTASKTGSVEGSHEAVRDLLGVGDGTSVYLRQEGGGFMQGHIVGEDAVTGKLNVQYSGIDSSGKPFTKNGLFSKNDFVPDSEKQQAVDAIAQRVSETHPDLMDQVAAATNLGPRASAAESSATPTTETIEAFARRKAKEAAANPHASEIESLNAQLNSLREQRLAQDPSWQSWQDPDVVKIHARIDELKYATAHYTPSELDQIRTVTESLRASPSGFTSGQEDAIAQVDGILKRTKNVGLTRQETAAIDEYRKAKALPTTSRQQTYVDAEKSLTRLNGYNSGDLSRVSTPSARDAQSAFPGLSSSEAETLNSAMKTHPIYGNGLSSGQKDVMKKILKNWSDNPQALQDETRAFYLQRLRAYQDMLSNQSFRPTP